MRPRLTVGLRAKTLADLASLFQINVPALGLARLVLECEGIDAVALLDGVLAFGIGGIEGLVDGVECGRSREFVCRAGQSPSRCAMGSSCLTVLERHVGRLWIV